MENPPEPVSINMEPYTYSKNEAGPPAVAFGATAVTSSVVTSAAPGDPAAVPQDFVLWSFFSTLFCNPCCFGFLALVFSIKARDSKIAQDQGAAETYGRTAKHLNIVALCLGIITIIIGIVLLALYFDTFRRTSL